MVFATEELSVFIASLSSFRRSMVNGRAGIFHTGEIDWQTEVSVTELILRKFPSSPEKPVEPHMHKQCIPGAPSDFSSAWERGY